MSTTRTTIKDAIIAAIKGDATIASTRVYKGRANLLPNAATSWPVVYVWMAREDTETDTLSRSRHRLNSMSLMVDYWEKAADPATLENNFDTATGKIVNAVCVTSIAGAAGQDVVLTSTEFLYGGDEDTPFGCARLTFNVKYFTTEP